MRHDGEKVTVMDKNKKKWILPIVILVLAISSAVLIGINKNQTEERLASLGQETVIITVGDLTLAQLQLEDIKAMPKVLIDEGLNTSTGQEDVVFGGVLLKDALDRAGFDYESYQAVTYKALDGYVSAGTTEEIEADKVYLIYERDGIENTDKSSGGTGPMEIVITGETFSLRNCKFLMEISFE
ncbi:hypothetical protein Q5O24_12105 [Eubacteriaceae bacterium ES3]|nr:hypothetical protein Q5O24_12105 [Eubacteriaceae bacterium ES3]